MNQALKFLSPSKTKQVLKEIKNLSNNKNTPSPQKKAQQNSLLTPEIKKNKGDVKIPSYIKVYQISDNNLNDENQKKDQNINQNKNQISPLKIYQKNNTSVENSLAQKETQEKSDEKNKFTSGQKDDEKYQLSQQLQQKQQCVYQQQELSEFFQNQNFNQQQQLQWSSTNQTDISQFFLNQQFKQQQNCENQDQQFQLGLNQNNFETHFNQISNNLDQVLTKIDSQQENLQDAKLNQNQKEKNEQVFEYFSAENQRQVIPKQKDELINQRINLSENFTYSQDNFHEYINKQIDQFQDEALNTLQKYSKEEVAEIKISEFNQDFKPTEFLQQETQKSQNFNDLNLNKQNFGKSQQKSQNFQNFQNQLNQTFITPQLSQLSIDKAKNELKNNNNICFCQENKKSYKPTRTLRVGKFQGFQLEFLIKKFNTFGEIISLDSHQFLKSQQITVSFFNFSHAIIAFNKLCQEFPFLDIQYLELPQTIELQDFVIINNTQQIQLHKLLEYLSSFGQILENRANYYPDQQLVIFQDIRAVKKIQLAQYLLKFDKTNQSQNIQKQFDNYHQKFSPNIEIQMAKQILSSTILSQSKNENQDTNFSPQFQQNNYLDMENFIKNYQIQNKLTTDSQNTFNLQFSNNDGDKENNMNYSNLNQNHENEIYNNQLQQQQQKSKKQLNLNSQMFSLQNNQNELKIYQNFDQSPNINNQNFQNNQQTNFFNNNTNLPQQQQLGFNPFLPQNTQQFQPKNLPYFNPIFQQNQTSKQQNDQNFIQYHNHQQMAQSQQFQFQQQYLQNLPFQQLKMVQNQHNQQQIQQQQQNQQQQQIQLQQQQIQVIPSTKKAIKKENFQINLDLVFNQQDQRSTIMIRNIPNRYNQQEFLKIIDVNFLGTYDFIYLPMDFKVCQVCYARIQGKQELITHFKRSGVMNSTVEKSFQPLILDESDNQQAQQIYQNSFQFQQFLQPNMNQQRML
ncbi:hypothetical protein PPERSA_06430 [Pseudocohnilembus persalinus]|uniref:Mei2-like C-terminal RNA recognition motif domain-containing protein n=1 Tax=Pseudocohnilembus persalinus TaxID=266149 RepID=A0A0V0QRI1_PSEPJ|nr:hypothetical protein PPERSA_06430 [Pseudocohnilembus persalinus]|eukprot:KRX04796.1 hypothetical protein PPERSA_06430 [Pseudocohnilembus persalinus]